MQLIDTWNFNFFIKNKTSKVHSSINFENKKSMKRNVLSHKICLNITMYTTFFEFFTALFDLAKILSFLSENKTSKAYVSVNFENKPSMKRNFFLFHGQIYLNIPFTLKCSEFFIHLLEFVKIFIF